MPLGADVLPLARDHLHVHIVGEGKFYLCLGSVLALIKRCDVAYNYQTPTGDLIWGVRGGELVFYLFVENWSVTKRRLNEALRVIQGKLAGGEA